MKYKLPVLLLTCLISALCSFGQQKEPAPFTPAQSTNRQYNALYVLNESDEKKVKGLLRNIKNALADERLEGKLKIEVIAFGDGVELYKMENKYDTLMRPLMAKGVVFVQCTNTIRERKIEKSTLWPFVNYVPSGNGEIILRHYEGWAIVKP